LNSGVKEGGAAMTTATESPSFDGVGGVCIVEELVKKIGHTFVVKRV
jgi:hypothetical protein